MVEILRFISEHVESAQNDMSQENRVNLFNQIVMAIQPLVGDVGDDPVTAIQLVPTESVYANDYNPNVVAEREMELLRDSIDQDGVTMPIVAFPSGGRCFEVVDGFHRRQVLREQMRSYVPVSIIDKPLKERMASTVRHNRARGKHQIDLQAMLVRSMIDLGMSDEEVASQLGMSVEEMLRLRQLVGAAKLLAGPEYNSTYGRDDEPPNMLDD